MREYEAEYEPLTEENPQLAKRLSFAEFVHFSIAYHANKEIEGAINKIDDKLYWLDSKVGEIKDLMP